MFYENVFELLEAVHNYELRDGECIIPSSSEKGTHVGFCTADGDYQSVRWIISIRDLKTSAEGSPEIYQQMRLLHTRRELLHELRAGRVDLERPVEPVPELESEAPPKSPEEAELDAFLDGIDLGPIC